MRYYDRQGNPMPDSAGTFIFGSNADDRRVAETQVGDVWISTVYLGLDHQWGDGPPLIFETMAFSAPKGKADFGDELYCDRYSTEEEAQAGHDSAVKEFTEGRLP